MLREAETEERYSRQMRFAPIGPQGQRRLGEASILVLGAGALGASLAQHMVRAGVGRLRLVDRDYVEPSNLHRQTLFDEEDAEAALPKAVAAAAKLRRANGGARIEAFVADVNGRNVESLVADVDLVLDGTDNTAVRLLLSDACFSRGIPLVYGGVAGSGGMSALLVPGDNCCLRCLLGAEETPDGRESARTCDTIGVISPAVELVAALQAAEALKVLTGNRAALRKTWVTLDAWEFGVKEWKLPPPVEACPYCGWGEPEHDVASRSSAAAIDGVRLSQEDGAQADAEPEVEMPVVLCGRDTFQLTLDPAVSLAEWRRRLLADGCVITADNRYLVRALTVGGERIVIFAEGRSLIQGAGEYDRALAIYRRYLTEREGEGENG
ncbi:ThiF family adenylyltransferase [Paenibacillaceae bacterium WGS1546]|uniref:ThiF family adenylyltransferase n=1 Tax=Cohnella sp. WGS1546 TaxID=3366810 RepID=UPI00372D0B0E